MFLGETLADVVARWRWRWRWRWRGCWRWCWRGHWGVVLAVALAVVLPVVLTVGRLRRGRGGPRRAPPCAPAPTRPWHSRRRRGRSLSGHPRFPRRPGRQSKRALVLGGITCPMLLVYYDSLFYASLIVSRIIMSCYILRPS